MIDHDRYGQDPDYRQGVDDAQRSSGETTAIPVTDDFALLLRLMHVLVAFEHWPGNKPNSARLDPLYPGIGLRANARPLIDQIHALLAKYPYGTSPTCAGSKAPNGWYCTRAGDHEGPCAAVMFHWPGRIDSPTETRRGEERRGEERRGEENSMALSKEAQAVFRAAVREVLDIRRRAAGHEEWGDEELIERLVKRSGYSEGEAFAIVTRMTPPPRRLPAITVKMLGDLGREGFFEPTDEPTMGVKGVMWSEAAATFARLLGVTVVESPSQTTSGDQNG